MPVSLLEQRGSGDDRTSAVACGVSQLGLLGSATGPRHKVRQTLIGRRAITRRALRLPVSTPGGTSLLQRALPSHPDFVA